MSVHSTKTYYNYTLYNIYFLDGDIYIIHNKSITKVQWLCVRCKALDYYGGPVDNVRNRYCNGVRSYDKKRFFFSVCYLLFSFVDIRKFLQWQYSAVMNALNCCLQAGFFLGVLFGEAMMIIINYWKSFCLDQSFFCIS